jgi:outer membrane immunogenic protein
MSIPFRKTRPAVHHKWVLAPFLFAAATSIACRSTIAVAADMPMKAPSAPVYQWTGCYVGFNVGGGTSAADFTASVSAGSHLLGADPGLVSGDGSGSANTGNLVAGGQTGCNFQSGTLVYGLEGDFDYFHSNPAFSNNTDTLSDGVTPFTITQSLTTDFLATVRPRIGIAADRNFAYITGGAAFTRVTYTESYVDSAAPPGAGSASGSKFLTGWTAGAGWEYASTEHLMFRLEYLFAKFDTTSASGLITDAAGGANAFQGSANLVIQTLRAGVNFRF